METVPQYLTRLVDISESASRDALDGGPHEGAVVSALTAMQPHLQNWANDNDFWRSAQQFVNGVPIHIPPDFGVVMDEEQRVLADGLRDRSLATKILMDAEFPPANQGVVYGLVDNARNNISININVTIQQTVAAPPGPARKWRALRIVRKVFVVATGGLMVAADIVSPDVTLITKGLSIVSGLSTIASAIDIPSA
jgi:hypothetical protein